MDDNIEYNKKTSEKIENNSKSERDESIQRVLQDNGEKTLEIFKEVLENFDRMKIFKFYFIMNNFDKVIKKMKKKKSSPLKTRRSGNRQSRSFLKVPNNNSPRTANKIEKS